jgi:hypothetical protein
LHYIDNVVGDVDSGLQYSRLRRSNRYLLRQHRWAVAVVHG